MQKIFESENLYYVKVDESLVNAYLTMVNDPEVQNKISHKMKVYTLEGELEWIKTKLAKNALIFSMIEKDTNKFVGNIEIMHINDNIGELGISITPAMQDKHYGTESIKRLLEYAYNEIGLDGMDLNVYSTNPRAIHCYEKVGFVQTGVGKTEEDIHMEIHK